MADVTTWQARLGLALGPTLEELARLASERSAHAPAQAFEVLDFFLPWLGKRGLDARRMRVPGLTPKNVLPFAADSLTYRETALEHGVRRPTHYGFLVDADSRACDECPVVKIRRGWPPAEVVAPNLPSFLALVAYRGAINIPRASSPRAWHDAREFYEEEDGEVSENPEARRTGFFQAGRVLVDRLAVPTTTEPWTIGPSAPDGPLLYDEAPRIEDMLSPREALECGRALLAQQDATGARALVARIRDDDSLVPLADLLALDVAHASDDRGATETLAIQTAEAWLRAEPPFVHPAQWEELRQRLTRWSVPSKDLGQRIERILEVAARDSF